MYVDLLLKMMFVQVYISKNLNPENWPKIRKKVLFPNLITKETVFLSSQCYE